MIIKVFPVKSIIKAPIKKHKNGIAGRKKCSCVKRGLSNILHQEKIEIIVIFMSLDDSPARPGSRGQGSHLLQP